MYKKIIIISFLELLFLIAITGMFISLDNRIIDIYKELKVELHKQQSEIDKLQKEDRLISQDVVFLEKLIIEGGEKINE